MYVYSSVGLHSKFLNMVYCLMIIKLFIPNILNAAILYFFPTLDYLFYGKHFPLSFFLSRKPEYLAKAHRKILKSVFLHYTELS